MFEIGVSRSRGNRDQWWSGEISKMNDQGLCRPDAATAALIVSASPNRARWCSFPLVITVRHATDRLDWAAAGVPIGRLTLSWVSFTRKQSALCLSGHLGRSARIKQTENVHQRTAPSSAGLFLLAVWTMGREWASVLERERERESSSSDLCDCKDTKKAIEGIKVLLVIEPDWNLEHWTTTV